MHGSIKEYPIIRRNIHVREEGLCPISRILLTSAARLIQRIGTKETRRTIGKESPIMEITNRNN